MKTLFLVFILAACDLRTSFGQGSRGRGGFRVPSLTEVLMDTSTHLHRRPITDLQQSPDGSGTPIGIVDTSHDMSAPNSDGFIDMGSNQGVPLGDGFSDIGGPNQGVPFSDGFINGDGFSSIQLFSQMGLENLGSANIGVLPDGFIETAFSNPFEQTQVSAIDSARDVFIELPGTEHHLAQSTRFNSLPETPGSTSSDHHQASETHQQSNIDHHQGTSLPVDTHAHHGATPDNHHSDHIPVATSPVGNNGETGNAPLTDIHGNPVPHPTGLHVDLPGDHGNDNSFAVVHFGEAPIGSDLGMIDFNTGPPVVNSGTEIGLANSHAQHTDIPLDNTNIPTLSENVAGVETIDRINQNVPVMANVDNIFHASNVHNLQQNEMFPTTGTGFDDLQSNPGLSLGPTVQTDIPVITTGLTNSIPIRNPIDLNDVTPFPSDNLIPIDNSFNPDVPAFTDTGINTAITPVFTDIGVNPSVPDFTDVNLNAPSFIDQVPIDNTPNIFHASNVHFTDSNTVDLRHGFDDLAAIDPFSGRFNTGPSVNLVPDSHQNVFDPTVTDIHQPIDIPSTNVIPDNIVPTNDHFVPISSLPTSPTIGEFVPVNEEVVPQLTKQPSVLIESQHNQQTNPVNEHINTSNGVEISLGNPLGGVQIDSPILPIITDPKPDIPHGHLDTLHPVNAVPIGPVVDHGGVQIGKPTLPVFPNPIPDVPQGHIDAHHPVNAVPIGQTINHSIDVHHQVKPAHSGDVIIQPSLPDVHPVISDIKPVVPITNIHVSPPVFNQDTEHKGILLHETPKLHSKPNVGIPQHQTVPGNKPNIGGHTSITHSLKELGNAIKRHQSAIGQTGYIGRRRGTVIPTGVAKGSRNVAVPPKRESLGSILGIPSATLANVRSVASTGTRVGHEHVAPRVESSGGSLGDFLGIPTAVLPVRPRVSAIATARAGGASATASASIDHRGQHIHLHNTGVRSHSPRLLIQSSRRNPFGQLGSVLGSSLTSGGSKGGGLLGSLVNTALKTLSGHSGSSHPSQVRSHRVRPVQRPVLSLPVSYGRRRQ